MQFKTKELRYQWYGGVLQPKLRSLLKAVDAYSRFHFGKQILVTSLVRKNNKHSVHYWGRGADIRSWIYTQSEIQDLLRFVIENFPYEGARYESAMYHSAGSGFHIHLQTKNR